MNACRILLVDDEEELVTTLVERLELRGIQAEAATSGKQALELMEKKDFQVAVIDLKMPGLSGVNVVDAIRNRHPRTKVLLITGHGSEDGSNAEAPQGGYEVLLKPFSLNALVERIHAVMKISESAPDRRIQ